MKNLSKHLHEDYDRVIRALSHDDLNYGDTITVDDILRAHYLICDYFEATTGAKSLFGVKSIDLVISACSRPLVGMGDTVKWPEPLQKAATLFYGIVKNHGFHDGQQDLPAALAAVP
jgi:prophage maintenance system killer protein